jgi:hypothetical protein
VFLGETKRDRERHVLAITVHDEGAIGEVCAGVDNCGIFGPRTIPLSLCRAGFATGTLRRVGLKRKGTTGLGKFRTVWPC